MKTDLKDYFKVYNNALSQELCDETIKQLHSVKWEEHKFYSTIGLIDNGSEPLEYKGTIESDEKLKKSIWETIRRYVLEDIKFDWFPGWNGFSDLKFIKYQINQEMKNHCDHIHSLYDGIHKGIPILSIIGLLNDDFDGGDLVLLDEKINLKKGDVIIFPSNFLFPHKINKIIFGTRYSVVTWVN